MNLHKLRKRYRGIRTHSSRSATADSTLRKRRPPKDFPHVLYRITVRGICRNWKSIDVIVSQKACRKTCRGGTGIILEKREPGRSRNIGTTTGRIIRSIYCLAVNLPFTITSSDLKVCLIDTTSTEAVILQNIIICLTFMAASINSNTTICVGQVESGFVTKNDITLLSFYTVCCPLLTFSATTWSYNRPMIRPMAANSTIPETISYCISTNSSTIFIYCRRRRFSSHITDT